MAPGVIMGGQISNYATWYSHTQVMIESAIRYNHMMLNPPDLNLSRDFPYDLINNVSVQYQNLVPFLIFYILAHSPGLKNAILCNIFSIY